MTTEDKQNPRNKPLTKEDLQRLEGMFFQTLQELYVITTLIEGGLITIYHRTKDYRDLVKKYGKQRADAQVAHTVHDQLYNHDEMYHTGTILRKITDLKVWLDRLFEVGTATNPKAKDAEKKQMKMAEELISDGRLLAWRHAMQCNIHANEDIKLDSTLKLLAKGDIVSDRIIARLDTTI